MYCNKCGKELVSGALFCSFCGAKQIAVCANCGTELMSGALFCHKCGTKAGAVEEKAEAESTDSEAESGTDAEAVDDETAGIVWAVLSKWKGVWHFSSYYDSLESIIQGI